MRPRRCRRGFWTSLSILHSLFVSLLSCISIPRHSAETYLPLFISSYSSYSLYASYFWLLSPFISISPFGAIKPLRSCILSLLPILSSALFHSSSLISYGIPCRLSLSLSLSALLFYVSVSVLMVLLPSWQFRKSSLPDTTRSISFLLLENRENFQFPFATM